MASTVVELLLLDLLEWIGPGGRPYREVMDAWQTSCPQLPVWEEATSRGLVSRSSRQNGGAQIILSVAGKVHLRHHMTG